MPPEDKMTPEEGQNVHDFDEALAAAGDELPKLAAAVRKGLAREGFSEHEAFELTRLYWMELIDD